MAVPSMLIRAPRGMVKSQMVSGTLRAFAILRDIGMVAAEEAVPQAVSHAGEQLNQNVYGFFLVMTENIMGMTMSRWRKMPQSAPPSKTPRLSPMVATSSLNKLGRIRKNTPMGASLMRKVTILVMIFSASLTARRMEESGPSMRQPITTES